MIATFKEQNRLSDSNGNFVVATNMRKKGF